MSTHASRFPIIQARKVPRPYAFKKDREEFSAWLGKVIKGKYKVILPDAGGVILRNGVDQKIAESGEYLVAFGDGSYFRMSSAMFELLYMPVDGTIS